MVVSILHRASGIALSVAGLAILTWWLMALALGPEAYAAFAKAAHRQSFLIAQSPDEPEEQAFIDAIAAPLEE